MRPKQPTEIIEHPSAPDARTRQGYRLLKERAAKHRDELNRANAPLKGDDNDHA